MRTTEVIADPVTTGVEMNDMMKALVYGGPGQRAWQAKPRPVVRDPGDAVVWSGSPRRPSAARICTS